MSAMIRHRPTAAMVAIAALLSATAVTGCGDDDEGGDARRSERDFCQLALELDQQEDLPTAGQLEAYREAAPEQIADSVTVVVSAFLQALEVGDPTSMYSDPAVEEAFEPIEVYEADHCGIEQRP